MPGFLEKLRQKPERTRKQIAAGTSFAVTGLIFVMWVTVLNHQPAEQPIQQRVASQESQQTTQQPERATSPLSALSANAKSAFSQLSTQFTNWKDDAAETFSATNSPAQITSSTEPRFRVAGEEGEADRDLDAEQSNTQNESVAENGSEPVENSSKQGHESVLQSAAALSAINQQSRASEVDPEDQSAGLPDRSGAGSEDSDNYWANADFSGGSSAGDEPTGGQEESASASTQTASTSEIQITNQPAFNSPQYNPNRDTWFGN